MPKIFKRQAKMTSTQKSPKNRPGGEKAVHLKIFHLFLVCFLCGCLRIPQSTGWFFYRKSQHAVTVAPYKKKWAFQVRNLDFQWSIFTGKLLVSGRVHPGRLMAGTYSHHPFLTRKMISTKPPGNYVPAANLQACKSYCFFSDMFFLPTRRETRSADFRAFFWSRVFSSCHLSRPENLHGSAVPHGNLSSSTGKYIYDILLIHIFGGVVDHTKEHVLYSKFWLLHLMFI